MLQGEEIIRAYFAAWNQNDPKIRRMLLERCCAEDAVILIGGRQISGRTEIDVSIARFRRDCPDDVGELTSGIDMVGNWCCFTARVVRPDGTSYSEFLDVVEIGTDCRIVRVLTFTGTNPRLD